MQMTERPSCSTNSLIPTSDASLIIVDVLDSVNGDCLTRFSNAAVHRHSSDDPALNNGFARIPKLGINRE